MVLQDQWQYTNLSLVCTSMIVRWGDFARNMFWLAVVGGGVILLHILTLLFLRWRIKSKLHGALSLPRFELFLLLLSVPALCQTSAFIIRGIQRGLHTPIFYCFLYVEWAMVRQVQIAQCLLYYPACSSHPLVLLLLVCRISYGPNCKPFMWSNIVFKSLFSVSCMWIQLWSLEHGANCTPQT